ncbi:CCAAT/enhancer-binding protein zeta-like [Salvelinus sp. IW2-2015]|uniref:CCAAT/enhancer-binding protein zeta-like n=1 Tax=Salvelinus sp. IW2-2015 TaxID=2691554 RepID=UPI0038D4675F
MPSCRISTCCCQHGTESKTNYVNVKDEFENDNDEGDDDVEEEKNNGDGPQPDDEFNLDEVLRLGGTRGEFINYTGDPLQDFTLSKFLDRFFFRNPKQLKGKQNTDASVMQPKQKLAMNNIQNLPVNCEELLSNEESQIPVDEVFYRFFKKREAEKALHRPRGDGDSESVEDV